MDWPLLLALAFLSGSLPFSVWLGRLVLGRDVRKFGDGNPGSVNVIRAGGKALGIIVLLLDISKAAAPVGWAYQNMGLRGLPMFLIAVAPLLGHIFSPFLGLKGGKAIAPALGVWIGLTLWKASLPGVLATLAGILLTASPGWAVMFGMLAILLTLLIWLPEPLLLFIWVSVTLLLAYTHRTDLRQRLRLNPDNIRRLFPSAK